MNLNPFEIFPGVLVGFVCFLITLGALYISKSFYKSSTSKLHTFTIAWKFATSKRALLATGMMPFICILLFYTIIAHVRLTLGRWPNFGETVAGEVLKLHIVASQYCILGMFFSLYAVGVMALLGFAFKRMRWLSFSSLIHMVFAGISFGSLFLAPHQFLNWLFD